MDDLSEELIREFRVCLSCVILKAKVLGSLCGWWNKSNPISSTLWWKSRGSRTVVLRIWRNVRGKVSLLLDDFNYSCFSSHDDDENDETELRRRNVLPRPIRSERCARSFILLFNELDWFRESGVTRATHFGGSRQVGWIQWFRTLLSMPFQFIWHSIWDLLAFFGLLLGIYILNWGLVEFFNGYSRPAVTDPIGDVNVFLEQQARFSFYDDWLIRFLQDIASISWAPAIFTSWLFRDGTWGQTSIKTTACVHTFS